MRRNPYPIRLAAVACALAAGLSHAAERPGAIDYALGSHAEAWLTHPVLGEASFDSFQRVEGNPLCRGKPPYEWPVNGFLFRDPQSGNWFAYVGNYREGYKPDPDAPSYCSVFRSEDRGDSWQPLGKALSERPHVFEGEEMPLARAPDVSVAYADGRYHMCFDWATANLTWAVAADPPPDANGGVGYAWSDRPGGPFYPAKAPVATTRAQEPLLGKYKRLYASTIIPRAHDWLVLTLTDSGPYFGWALLGMTAQQPAGPYSDPKLLLHPQAPGFHPPLLEFFPAFTHEGHIYQPATSVAADRNVQALFRVPLEDAMRPEAWELAQWGSLWHAEPAENEHYGIWGQTFTGFVDDSGVFQVLFPSRDKDGFGTINFARRPWKEPLRQRGFVVSAHQSPTLALLRRSGPARECTVRLRCRGTIRILWNYHGAAGPDAPRSNSKPHPCSLRDYCAVELADERWAVIVVDEDGNRYETAAGETGGVEPTVVRLVWEKEETRLFMESTCVWEGNLLCGSGLFGLMAEPGAHAEVSRFVLDGARNSGTLAYLYTDAFVGAAQRLEDWEVVEGEAFRFGVGAVSGEDSVEAKWNVEGAGVDVYAPRGPQYGAGTLYVDGHAMAPINFNAAENRLWEKVHSLTFHTPGRHGVTLRPVHGKIPVDTLEVRW